MKTFIIAIINYWKLLLLLSTILAVSFSLSILFCYSIIITHEVDCVTKYMMYYESYVAVDLLLFKLLFQRKKSELMKIILLY